jgi:hypothetical protein
VEDSAIRENKASFGLTFVQEDTNQSSSESASAWPSSRVSILINNVREHHNIDSDDFIHRTSLHEIAEQVSAFTAYKDDMFGLGSAYFLSQIVLSLR